MVAESLSLPWRIILACAKLENPNKKKDYGLRIRHKITLKEFEEFIEEANGRSVSEKED